MEDIRVDKITPMNIIFPLRGDDVLLGIKTRKIGVGLFNGWGGKQEAHQTMLQSCVAEFKKESGLDSREQDFIKVAEVSFYIHKNDGRIVLNQCDIFFIERFTGTPQVTEEMREPTWFPKNKLPWSKMMIDAPFWVPQILAGERMRYQIHYDDDRKNILGSIQSIRLD